MEVKPGVQVMVQQRKSTVKTPWDPSPYIHPGQGVTRGVKEG